MKTNTTPLIPVSGSVDFCGGRKAFKKNNTEERQKITVRCNKRTRKSRHSVILQDRFMTSLTSFL